MPFLHYQEVDTTMLTYTQLINNTIERYVSNDAKSAFDYIESHYERINGIDAQIYNFRYATAAPAGLRERAIELLEEAVIRKKYWYSLDYLNTDDDLDCLREDIRFKHCLMLCEAREIVAKESTVATYKEFPATTQKQDDKVLIAFHGNQENSAYTIPYWSTNALSHYKKVFPQSPTIEFSNGFSWNDDLSLYEDIMTELSTYKKQILTGFSAGGHMALECALTTPANCKGLILIAPWLPNIEDLETRIEVLSEYKIPLYIICGNKDEDCFDCTSSFRQLLDAKNIDYSYHEVLGLNHDYPENFDQYLECAIKHIENHQLLDTKGFDKWAGSYDKSILPLSYGYPFEGYYDLLSSIQKIVNNIKVIDVLDMGIGTGLLTKQLYDQGYSITGLDFSETMIEQAKLKMPNASLYVGDFKEEFPIDIKKKSYEAIISSYALHHLVDTEKITFIHKLYQQLAYGGVLIIGDISFQDEKQLFNAKAIAGDDWDDQEHYYTANYLLEALKAINICATYQQLSSCAGLLKIIKV